MRLWLVHSALVSCGGSRVRGTSTVQQSLKQQTAALCGAVMGPISNSGKEHWSTFKCNRTSHSALQMLILASRYPTKPAFLTLAASKAAYVPRKNIQEEKPKKKWGKSELLNLFNNQSITVHVTVEDMGYCMLQICPHNFLHLEGRTVYILYKLVKSPKMNNMY